MRDSFKQELILVIDQVRITSQTSFIIKEQSFQVNPYDTSHSIMQSTHQVLIASLQQQLYNRCYTQNIEDPASPSQTETLSNYFIEVLSKANAGEEKWISGWNVLQTDSLGGIQVQKGQQKKYFTQGQYQIHQTAPGQPIVASVFLPKESLNGQPGFYIAFGNARERIEFQDDILRIYWHITAQGAQPLVHHLTKQLNYYEIPFSFKCASYPHLYARRDPAVLYLKSPYFEFVLRILKPVYKKILPYLIASVPLFTKAIGKGVALAEDPGTGESFGMHRCRLLAEAIVFISQNGISLLSEKLAAVERYFQQQGLNLDTPFLNSKTADIYQRNFNS